jgi:hypothetical protein
MMMSIEALECPRKREILHAKLGESYRIDRRHLRIATHGVKVASTPFEIAIEALCNFQDPFNVFHGELLLIVYGERLGSADAVLDL